MTDSQRDHKDNSSPAGQRNVTTFLLSLAGGTALGVAVQFRKYEKGFDEFWNWSFLILALTGVVSVYLGYTLWRLVLRDVFGRTPDKARKSALIVVAPVILLLLYPLLGFLPLELRFKMAALAVASIVLLAAIADLARVRKGVLTVSANNMLRMLLLIIAVPVAAALGNCAHNMQKAFALAEESGNTGDDIAEVSLDRDIRNAFVLDSRLDMRMEILLEQRPHLVFSLGPLAGKVAPDQYYISLDIQSSDNEKEIDVPLRGLFTDGKEGWQSIAVDLADFRSRKIRLRVRTKTDSKLSFFRNATIREQFLLPAWNWKEEDRFSLAYMTRPQIVHGLTGAKDFNIILILLDTLRADHLRLYGYERETAPNLSKIAEECLLFDNFLSPSTWTLPSHVSLFTSLYPSSHRIHLVEKQVRQIGFQTLGELLKEKGYYNVAFTDSGFVGSTYGLQQGYDHFDERGYGIEQNVNKAIDWIDGHADLKFFLFLHTYEIHDYFFRKPQHVEPYGTGYAGRIKNNFKDLVSKPEARTEFDPLAEDVQFMVDVYDGAIRYADGHLHRLFQNLKDIGLYDDTMIIVTSDHGESFDELHDNSRFSAWHHGNIPYQSQIRIPLIVKMPKRLSASPMVVNEPFSLIDIMPTLAGLLGAEPENSLQGISWAGVIDGRQRGNENRTIIAMPAQKNLNHVISVTQGGFKFIRWEENIELYDLDADPEENHNLAEQAEFADMVQRFSKLIDEYLEECGRFESSSTLGDGIPDEVKRNLQALGYLE